MKWTKSSSLIDILSHSLLACLYRCSGSLVKFRYSLIIRHLQWSANMTQTCSSVRIRRISSRANSLVHYVYAYIRLIRCTHKDASSPVGCLCRTHSGFACLQNTFSFLHICTCIYVYLMMQAVKLCIYTLLEVAACVSFIMCESRTHPHVFDCCFLYRNIYIYILRQVRTRRSCSWNFNSRTKTGSTR